MTYQLKSKIRQLKQEIQPTIKKDVSWREEDGTIEYKGKFYNSEKELTEATPDVDLMYVISFMNNATGKVVKHA